MNRLKTLLNDSFNGKCQKWVADRKRERKNTWKRKEETNKKNILII